MTAPKPRDQLTKVRWSADEDETLRELWPRADLPDILDALPGRSAGSCGRRAHELGVRCVARRHLAKVVSPVIRRAGVDGKACTKCLEWEPLPKFARSGRHAAGRRNICTTCEGRIAYKGNRRARIDAVRRYQKRHPEKAKLQAAASQGRYRARKRKQDRGVTPAQLKAVKELYGGVCVYCGDDADTFDHVEPLSRGGLHEVGNIVPACRPCNSSKKDKMLDEWEPRRRMEN